MRMVLVFALLAFDLSAKIRLLTFHFNAPELIELQYKTFKKFMLDEYELIVFNDGNSPEREQGIQEVCDRYGIRCIRYEQEWHEKDPLNLQIKNWLDDPKNHNPANPGLSVNGIDIKRISMHGSVRHCHVIQYALNNFGYWHNDIVAIVDGDLMPIRAVSLRVMLEDSPLIGIRKYWWSDHIEYLWVPFIAFDPQRVPDLGHLRFNIDIIKNKLFDSGACSYYYIKDHPELNVKKYSMTNEIHFSTLSIDELMRIGYTSAEAELIRALPPPNAPEFHIENRFIHLGASSFDKDTFDAKFRRISEFLEKIL